MSLPDAMAALTENMEPKRWRAKWLVEKFNQMGMPKRLAEDGMVLMFLPGFVASMKRVAADEVAAEMRDTAFEVMIDNSRVGAGHVGMAVWTNRPTLVSKTAGAPEFKIRGMQIRRRP